MKAPEYITPDSKGRRHEVTTPEGVVLPFAVSSAGDRLIAFLVDNILQASIIIVLIYGSIKFGYGSGVVNFLALVLLFLVWNLYFIFFELRWQGQTPGKRLRRLRVIDRHGGILSADAIIVRNLMRQIELFIPLGFIAAPQQYFGSAPGWLTTLSILWLLGFFFFPLLHKKHLRIGDLVGGTIVIHTPKIELAETLDTTPSEILSAPKLIFEPSQLESYGEYELQVLEGILRRYDDGLTVDGAIHTVAHRIQDKTKWHWPAGMARDDILFLRSFYRAQRERLEQRMLLGNRRKHKADD